MEALQKLVLEEDARQAKAKKREYKYATTYSSGSYFTAVPKVKAVAGLEGEALTKANFDKSLIMGEVM